MYIYVLMLIVLAVSPTALIWSGSMFSMGRHLLSLLHLRTGSGGSSICLIALCLFSFLFLSFFFLVSCSPPIAFANTSQLGHRRSQLFVLLCGGYCSVSIFLSKALYGSPHEILYIYICTSLQPMANPTL